MESGLRKHLMSLPFKSTAAPLLTALVLALAMSSNASAQSPMPFVPKEFKVPEKLETKEFRLRMLTVNDVVKDYDAVMTSVEHLKTVWPGGSWPEGLTFEGARSGSGGAVGVVSIHLRFFDFGRFHLHH